MTTVPQMSDLYRQLLNRLTGTFGGKIDDANADAIAYAAAELYHRDFEPRLWQEKSAHDVLDLFGVPRAGVFSPYSLSERVIIFQRRSTQTEYVNRAHDLLTALGVPRQDETGTDQSLKWRLDWFLSMPVIDETVGEETVRDKPVRADSVEVGAVEVGPVEANPVEANPVDADPVQADPVQADPVQADPVQAAVEAVATAVEEAVEQAAAGSDGPEEPEVNRQRRPGVVDPLIVEHAGHDGRNTATASPVEEVAKAGETETDEQTETGGAAGDEPPADMDAAVAEEEAADDGAKAVEEDEAAEDEVADEPVTEGEVGEEPADEVEIGEGEDADTGLADEVVADEAGADEAGPDQDRGEGEDADTGLADDGVAEDAGSDEAGPDDGASLADEERDTDAVADADADADADVEVEGADETSATEEEADDGAEAVDLDGDIATADGDGYRAARTIAEAELEAHTGLEVDLEPGAAPLVDAVRALEHAARVEAELAQAGPAGVPAAGVSPSVDFARLTSTLNSIQAEVSALRTLVDSLGVQIQERLDILHEEILVAQGRLGPETSPGAMRAADEVTRVMPPVTAPEAPADQGEPPDGTAKKAGRRVLLVVLLVLLGVVVAGTIVAGIVFGWDQIRSQISGLVHL